jgi:hypothetical protein
MTPSCGSSGTRAATPSACSTRPPAASGRLRSRQPRAPADVTGGAPSDPRQRRRVNSPLGVGPTGPGVLLTLPLSFKPSAAGRTFRVEVAASDDLGNEDPFVEAGTLTITRGR